MRSPRSLHKVGAQRSKLRVESCLGATAQRGWQAQARSALGALSVALLSVGCAGHASRTEEARSALDAGQPKLALALLNQELGVDHSTQQPDDLSGDNALLLLDRAMVLQQLGRYRQSSKDLETADKQVDMLDLSRGTADEIGKYLFSDDAGPYRAPAYEKLLINTMNLLNYLVRHDLNGARVEARRLAVMQRYLKEYQGQGVALTGPGSYLAGFAFERSGRATQALRYYDEALQYGNYASLAPAVRRLAAESSYRSPRIRRLLSAIEAPIPMETLRPNRDDHLSSTGVHAARHRGPEALSSLAVEVDASSSPSATPAPTSAPAAPDTATPDPAVPDPAVPDPAPPSEVVGPAKQPVPCEVLVVINYGRVPAKVAKRVPIGLALTWAASHMPPQDHAQANRLAAQGLVTWVNYPALGRARGQYEIPEFSIDGAPAPLDAALGVDLEAKAAWKDAEGAVVGAAITRLVTRLVAGEVARTAVGGDSIWGILASLGTQATLSAADTPDTRSWAMLPARMAIGRQQLQPGTHSVRIGARGSYTTTSVRLAPGGWAVLSLTVLS